MIHGSGPHLSPRTTLERALDGEVRQSCWSCWVALLRG